MNVPFSKLSQADLVVDAVCEGGTANKNVKDDPLRYIFDCGNQGGIRFKGSPNKPPVNFCVLYSTLIDPDWPDELDTYSGQFLYFGDNKKPGHELHETKRGGNKILRHAFEKLYSGSRDLIPPFFIFNKGPTGRDVIFRGIAIPGSENLSESEDLTAVWRTTEGKRFQNYKATFTILNISKINRSWINDLNKGNGSLKNAPAEWKQWIKTGKFKPLTAPKAVKHRKKDEQLPKSKLEIQLLETLVQYFKKHPKGEYAFELCAVELIRLMDANVGECETTRPWRDGGRDAIGKYKIGIPDSSLEVDFALEAKCKVSHSSCTIKETSRLISRLRHRQLGFFVTTSYLATQAYKEIIEDEHPVLILAGGDIAKILLKHGIKTKAQLNSWLSQNFA